MYRNVHICILYATCYLNCWKPLKLYILQRKNEIGLGVNVTKVEKKYIDDIWLNPKYFIMGNQQVIPDKGKPQRLFREEVGTSVPKWVISYLGKRYSLFLLEIVRSS
jgi:hypothetical protein